MTLHPVAPAVLAASQKSEVASMALSPINIVASSLLVADLAAKDATKEEKILMEPTARAASHPPNRVACGTR